MRRRAWFPVAIGLASLIAQLQGQTDSRASRPAAPLVLEKKIGLGDRGQIAGIAVHPGGSILHVAGSQQRWIRSFDIQAGKYLGGCALREPPAALVAFGEPVRLAVTFPEGHAWNETVITRVGETPENRSGACGFFDANSLMTLTRAATGHLSDVGNLRRIDRVRADPSGTQVWVAYRDGLALLDPSKPQPVRTIGLAGAPTGFEVECGARRRVFANVPTAGHVAVVDSLKGEVLDRWKLADAKENGPMALDEQAQRLFVACAKPPKILMYDTEKGRVIGWGDGVADAGEMFVDEARKRLYVIGNGVISVLSIERDRLKAVAKIRVFPGARVAAWVPSIGRLCVGVPFNDADSDLYIYRAQP